MSGDAAQLVDGAWTEIVRGGERLGSGWRSKNLPVRARGRLLALAVDESGEHHLLVPKGPESLPTTPHSPLAVSVRDFSFSGAGGEPVEGSYLDIHCRIAGLNGQFDKVVLDVIEAIKDSKNPAAAAAASVAAWRRLFAKLADLGALTYQQRIAVFGELSVLQDVVENVRAFQPDWWTGPRREPHDFELPDVSLEVKSVGEGSATVTIHGFDQMEKSEGKPLHVVVRKVIERPSGKTVAELLSEILSIAGGASEIRERAAAIGVFDTDPDVTRFEVSETLVGEVSAGFPRIAQSDLSPEAQSAVSNINYDLDIEMLKSSMAIGSVGDIVRSAHD
ncbi:PD-(D/E)XK motif protein [Gordonia zhaorongruii]|uniref:PD-(D/E)XK motif protein n=1 Tax=Gordonia zhaorongruii TaxID=2597659 RepID=UPI0010437CC3|nr:PD-(D/E)XK motif protein [Gordonia zhaorongruii]